MSTTGESGMFESLAISVAGPVGRLQLNQPDKLNPLSPATLVEIANAARWFDSQPEIRVVIVSGAGRVFSAGADLSGFAEGEGRLTRETADAGRRMADALEAMRAVAIASIHGWCVGGGIVMAAACDLRVAAHDTQFSIPEIDLGIPLAWGGIPRLVREIGPAMAKELVMTCRPFDASEAKACGFLNRVVPPEALDETVQDLAASLAARPALGIQATKQHVNAVTSQMVGTDRSWADADGLVTALADPESAAARAAYLDKRGSKR
jgi:enoyl-CoA hydratase/carnithine racemase